MFNKNGTINMNLRIILKKLVLGIFLVFVGITIENSGSYVLAMDEVVTPMKERLEEQATGNILCYMNKEGKKISLCSGAFNAIQKSIYPDSTIEKLNSIDVILFFAEESPEGDGLGTKSKKKLSSLTQGMTLDKDLFEHFLTALNAYVKDLSRKLKYVSGSGNVLDVKRQEGIDGAKLILHSIERLGYARGVQLLVSLLKLIGSGGTQKGWADLSKEMAKEIDGKKTKENVRKYRAGLDWLKYATHTEILIIALIGSEYEPKKDSDIVSWYQPCDSCNAVIDDNPHVFSNLLFMKLDLKHILPDYSVELAPYKWNKEKSNITTK